VHAFWRTSGPVLRAGRYEYELARAADGLKIKRKKVFVHDDRVIGAIDLYNI
jgi:hypothetical protein